MSKIQRWYVGRFNYHGCPDSAGNWCESSDVARLEATNADLLEALEDISEYWNRDQNEKAMSDALWTIIDIARAAIAKAKGEQP